MEFQSNTLETQISAQTTDWSESKGCSHHWWVPIDLIREPQLAIHEGCDTGFGNSLAKRLAVEGYHVLAGCLFPEGDGAKELKRDLRQNVSIIALDVTSDESVANARKVVQTLVKNKGKWWSEKQESELIMGILHRAVVSGEQCGHFVLARDRVRRHVFVCVADECQLSGYGSGDQSVSASAQRVERTGGQYGESGRKIRHPGNGRLLHVEERCHLVFGRTQTWNEEMGYRCHLHRTSSLQVLEFRMSFKTLFAKKVCHC